MSQHADLVGCPVALVTGGAMRLGRAIVDALSHSGYRVWVHHHRSPQPTEINGLLGSVRADLLDAQDRADLCHRVLEPEGPAGGRLDLLVNSAASFESGAFERRTDEDLQRVLTLNLVAPLSLIRGLAPALRATPHDAAPGGSVVNILDLGAQHPWRDRLDHCVSKAGLAAATRGLAAELAPVRINAVAPGTVVPAEGTTPNLGRIPRGRIADPKDVTQAILYLASAEHVSGHVLLVDGGQLAAIAGPHG